MNFSPDSELLVDNFAGGGGASHGFFLAFRRSPDIAINHNRQACWMHAMNHPHTRHLCEDVFSVVPRDICQGRSVGAVWFSPDCTHFSKARGKKPRSKNIRGLAWVILRWAVQVRPRNIAMENVEEFLGWGPLGEDGQPCPLSKGRTFETFRAALTTGIRSDNPDIPEIREILGRDFPIDALIAGLGYDFGHRMIRACDFGAPTIRRRLFGWARCDGQPIIWPSPTHTSPEDAARLGLPTWRTAAECIDWALPCHSIFLTKDDAKRLGIKVKRPLAENTMRRIGRGVWKFVIKAGRPFIVPVTHQGSVRVESIDEPFRTVTAAHRGERALVAPSITKYRTGSTGHRLDEPLATITAGPAINPAGAAHALGLVAAHLSKYHGERRENEQSRGLQPDEPLHTQSSENRFGVVSAFLAKHFGDKGQRPGSDMREPLSTVTGTDHNAVVAAHLVREFGASVGQDAAVPLGTVMPGGSGKTALAISHLTKLYGTSTAAPVDSPMPTVTGAGNHLAETRAFLTKYYGQGGQDQPAGDPMHTIPAKARMALVMVEGEAYEIHDIGTRMLTPRELYRAQGFPDSYVIDRVYVGEGDERSLVLLPNDAQVRMCGNSVCPPVAAALLRANLPELAASTANELVEA